MEAIALTMACACIYCIFVWSMQVDRRERRAKAPPTPGRATACAASP
ncbi:hypothetical protein [Hankyongella ginsenosidimutans]|nr:hypothetical protein [Hankyongella ginsenosidimutans]